MLLFGSLTAPLRADLSAFQAQEAFGRSDLQAAGDELLDAIRHQPRNGFYAEGMAIVYGDSGLYELEFSERVRSANLRPGNPFAAVVAAESAVRIGRLSDAEAWIERAVSIEPHGAKVLVDSAAVLVDIGRIDRALGLLEVFDSLRSSDIYRWKTVADIHRALGNAEAVERALLCLRPGQEGCWPAG
jgi:predicted Zn-dependent protease